MAAAAAGRNYETCAEVEVEERSDEAEVEGDKEDCKMEGDGGLQVLYEVDQLGPVDSQDAAYDHLDWMWEPEMGCQVAAAVVPKVQNPGSCQEV